MQEGKHLILCIDDDPDILDALKVILEANGYHYVGAATAEEGLQRYQQVSPDLVLVDLMIEEVDSGANFVKELKLLGGQVPIYLLSSVGDALNLSTSYAELGFTGILQKPVSSKTLLTLLKQKLK
jgi:two-component system response regulator ResD